MIQIDFIEDWTARLKSRLYTQFRGKSTWNAFCELLGAQFDSLESAGQSLLGLLDVDNSEGVQLDNIGKIIGQPRLGNDDATYRLYLRAKIAANRSTGTAENIYSVFRALFGDGASFRYVGGWVKQFSISVNATITRSEAIVGAAFLLVAKEAGSRAILEWREQESSQMFQFDAGTDGLGFDQGYFAGAIEA